MQPRQQDFVGTSIGPYSCLEVIGKGSSAYIYKGINTETHQMVALKIIDKNQINATANPAIRNLKYNLIRSEAEIMTICDSNYVVRMYDHFESEDHIVFVLEYCNGGDLYTIIKERERIPEEEARRILKQVVLGFAEFHKHNIIHRDLKAQNIFKHNERYKIGDLGFATIIESLSSQSKLTVLGSISTMAPQVYRGEKYGSKADIWSLGVVYFHMLFGQLPNFNHDRRNYSQKLEIIQASEISDESKQFLKMSLNPIAKQRLTWQQLYNLPLFQVDTLSTTHLHQQNVRLCQSMISDNVAEAPCIQQQLEDIKTRTTKQLKLMLPQKTETNMSQLKQKAQTCLQIDRHIQGYINTINFQTQKIKLILSQIIQPCIRKIHGIKIDRFTIQFAYLILKRCIGIISPINDSLKKQKNTFGWMYYKQFLNSSLYPAFLNQFECTYVLVNYKRKEIEQLLYTHQSKLSSRFHDFCKKIVKKESYSLKDTIVNGIQGFDYQLPQFYKFLKYQYTQVILGRIENILEDDRKGKTDYENSKRLWAYIDGFQSMSEAKYDPSEDVLKKLFKSRLIKLHSQLNR